MSEHKIPALDNPERVVTVVDAPPKWDTEGDSVAAGGWLGNATEHDREAIRVLARRVHRDGKSVHVAFPSVLPFILGYSGRGRYLIRVPEPADPEQRKVWDEYQPRDKR